MKDNNITPHKAYLESLGKTVKKLSAEELKEYYRIGNKYRYETKYKVKLKESSKEYRLANIEKISARQKAYYQKNKEEICARVERWQLSNKERIEARRIKGGLERKIKDWFQNSRWRCGGGAGKSFEEVVGLNIGEFMQHIESLFCEGMSWDNWGRGSGRTVWHIDHIHPVHKGGGNHYTNLQPLWGGDNIGKNNSSR